MKPYDIKADPSLTDSNGPLLVKTYRLIIRWSEEAHNAISEAVEKCGDTKNLEEWLIDKYGEEKGRSFYEVERIGSPIKDSWECRDCILLDDDEYFEKLKRRSS